MAPQPLASSENEQGLRILTVRAPMLIAPTTPSIRPKKVISRSLKRPSHSPSSSPTNRYQHGRAIDQNVQEAEEIRTPRKAQACNDQPTIPLRQSCRDVGAEENDPRDRHGHRPSGQGR